MTAETRTQSTIDAENASFWNELCGSSAARALGVVDDSPESLKKFDDWYMGYYPYLLQHVPTATFGGKRVLEIGLGYGTLSQEIARSGADYMGMDIAAGPVAMVQHRLRLLGLPGDAVQRSFLENGLPDASFDAIVAIGCFHHTGNVLRCFNETHRLLKPGGTAHLMVYNRYSHRRWTNNREEFLKEIVDEEFGQLATHTAEVAERFANDSNHKGEAAPETVFMSTREVEAGMAAFSEVVVHKENMDESMEPGMNRVDVLPTWGKRAGLDLYIVARK